MTASAQTPPRDGYGLVRKSACEGKQSFSTMTQAQKIAAKSRRQGNKSPYQAYRCKLCGLFHIGAGFIPRHALRGMK
jgi:hypothetical protein